MDWLQLRFHISRQQAEQLEKVLMENNALSVTLQSANDEDFFDTATPQSLGWQDIVMTALYSGDTNTAPILDAVSKAMGSSLIESVETSNLEDKDWKRVWLDSFKATEVGPSLWVCPSWQPPPNDDVVNIILDPGLAFGTGTHATTGLCLNWIARHPPANKTIIDYGCGSGILAIAGLLLGAQQAFAVDVDHHALTASHTNAVRNRVDHKLTISYPDDESLHTVKAELVIANILASVIIELADTIKQLVAPGGTLLLTGILADQSAQVLSMFDHQFDFEIESRGDWVLLIGRHCRPDGNTA